MDETRVEAMEGHWNLDPLVAGVVEVHLREELHENVAASKYLEKEEAVGQTLDLALEEDLSFWEA